MTAAHQAGGRKVKKFGGDVGDLCGLREVRQIHDLFLFNPAVTKTLHPTPIKPSKPKTLETSRFENANDHRKITSRSYVSSVTEVLVRQPTRGGAVDANVA